MLKPFVLYKSEIIKKMQERWFDLDYQYFDGGMGRESYLENIGNDEYNKRYFASVDKNNNVIGYCGYSFNGESMSCFNFGIMSFDKGNMEFIKDVIQMVEDIFFKYNFNRIEFLCYADNPAIRGYRKLVKRFGGRESGYCRQVSRLLDGKLHDCVVFEILRDDIHDSTLIKRYCENDVVKG